jgi:hypothetical protein
MADKPTPATPTAIRAITSYPARRKYMPGTVRPPEAPGVAGAIDIHCHAHKGQQDPLSLSILASENRMGGFLFKTIGSVQGPDTPVSNLKKLRDGLDAWSQKSGIRPIDTWVGWGLTRDSEPPSTAKLKANHKEGITAVWLPVANHANTYFKVGGRVMWWDKTASPKDHSEPLPWDEAVEKGFYMLDDKKCLKKEFEEPIRYIIDNELALFYGHATHDEIFAITELVARLGMKRAVVDHPFSPFIDLSVAEMKELASAGVTLNFTFDEISPLLGVDPAVMYKAIREVGVQHCTLSSDAGEPLFPHSVECMRLIRGFMEAFGMNKDELDTLCIRNPAKIVGKVLSESQRAAAE